MSNRDMGTRVKDQLPTVLLTLLSIVQALALELQWEHLTSTPELYALSPAAALEWLQMIATFMGVLLVWLIYSSMVMRFRWVPTTGDLVFPFFVGLLEFLLIELLGAHLLGPWLVTFAVVFALMTWSSQATYKRARGDVDNESFFGSTAPATTRDYLWSGSVVVILAVSGAIVWASSDIGMFAFISVLVVIGALAYQTRLTAMFWKRSVFNDE